MSQNNPLCASCTEFSEQVPGSGRNEDNCLQWLCYPGGCPRRIELSRQRRKGGAPGVADNAKTIQAAEAALRAHDDALGGIEGDTACRVWHLLASLQEYCAQQGVDLDNELQEVREGILSGELSLPASEAVLRSKRKID